MKKIILILLLDTLMLFAQFEILNQAEKLTVGDYNNITPSWSSDGQYIAFATKRDGEYDIAVISSDGSNFRKLTYNSNTSQQSPSWAPNDDLIVYKSKDNRDKSQLKVLSSLNGNDHTDDYEKINYENPNFTIDEGNPDWFPVTGSEVKIVYSSNQIDGIVYDLYLYTAGEGDSAASRQITNTGGFADNPSWTPSGEYLVFDATIGTGGLRDVPEDTDAEIYILSANEQEITSADYYKITDNYLIQDQSPSVSPDGQWVVYSSFDTPGGNQDLYIKDIQGQKERIRLTTSPAPDRSPEWSPAYPDGTSKIVYVSERDGYNHLYVITLKPITTQKLLIQKDTVHNFPNPYVIYDGTSVTTFVYNILNEVTSVKLNIYDIVGNQIYSEIITSGSQSNTNGKIGENLFEWDGYTATNTRIVSGLYFYEIIAQNDDNSTDKAISKFAVVR